MDLWIVAAAAGAGYAAKANYLKNSTRITERSLKTCSCEVHDHSQPRNLLQQIRDRTCPLCRLEDIKIAASSSGGTNYGETQIKNYGICKRNELLDLSSETVPESSTEEVGSYQRLPKSSQLKKRSNGYLLKPLNVSESWLTAELYTEDSRLEDYVYTSLSSPGTYMERALTIGSLIARRSQDFRKEMELEAQTGPCNSQGFSNNDLPFFFVGIATGMMLIVAYSKREADNLNELLKKNENLVHDLYEELEMKDHLTLKELANDNVNEPSLYGTPTAFPTKQDLKNSTKFEGEEVYEVKGNNSEAMSKIEAELEAELERLELTMKSSTLGRNFDYIQGGFGVDKVDGQVDTLVDSDDEASRSSPDHPQTGMFAVSPQELSLHLHGVIQARLTARIIELEAALENSQKRLHFLQSDL
ncbi:uncharacterized protein LOC8264711 isoform X1 [Ricinus communis]|uniref:uncharacterized protein LOC8264711 isoform X1 n=1 Tax=Ricinus communis TaxID=3988 RepID=UPI00201AB0A9|nr:uncharacterized protein LOC8264711 isoform X1 [Ricinus communis]